MLTVKEPKLDAAKRLASMANERWILLRESLRDEMGKREITSAEGVIGGLLSIERFRKTWVLPKLQMAPRGKKNVDAVSHNGEHIFIKTVCEGVKMGTILPVPEHYCPVITSGKSIDYHNPTHFLATLLR